MRTYVVKLRWLWAKEIHPILSVFVRRPQSSGAVHGARAGVARLSQTLPLVVNGRARAGDGWRATNGDQGCWSGMIKQWNSRQTFASMMSSQNDLCSEMGEREPMSSENWELGIGKGDG